MSAGAVMHGLEEKQAVELAASKQIACEELPILCDSDRDPSFWRDQVKTRKAAEVELPF